MTDKGRAAFNARHLRHGGGNAKGTSGTTGDRKLLLQEMMRELEEKWAQHHATKNLNIVLDDTHRNESFMFDPDTGGWKTPTSVDEVVAYGEDRAAQVGRKIGARSFETTTLVVHLPRTLCTEVPDYYPVYDKDGQIKCDKDGNELRRSRWVARDQDEANRYLLQATEWLADNVLPGGRAAVHGFNLQHDESTPHVQIMADTFAEHPDKPGVLRVEASQAWGSHRDVRYPAGHPQAGQQMGGNQKMRMYQKGLRKHMKLLGYDVELEVSERAHESLDKDRYAAEDDARRTLEVDQQKLKADQKTLAADQKTLKTDRENYDADAAVLGAAQQDFSKKVKAYEADLRAAIEKVDADEAFALASIARLEEVEEELNNRVAAVAGREKAVKAEEAALPELKRTAQEKGYDAGKTEGLEAAEKTAADIKENARKESERIAQQARDTAQRLRQEADDEAEKATATAAEEAERTRAAARKEAEQMRADAQSEATRIKAEATDMLTTAEQTTAQAEGIKAAAEQKMADASHQAATMLDEATKTKDAAHAEGFKQGLRQGRDTFTQSVTDLLTRDGGEKRLTMEIIATLAGGDHTRIDQAWQLVMGKLQRQAENALMVGTPVRPSRQKIESEAEQAAKISVTDPEQTRRIIAASSMSGRSPGRSVNKTKGLGPQLGR